jgi:hypothetical protein
MWRNLRYHPSILGKGTADERSKFLGQESQSLGSDLNSETPEYDTCVVCLVNELTRRVSITSYEYIETGPNGTRGKDACFD